jgi:hypothetical protein
LTTISTLHSVDVFSVAITTVRSMANALQKASQLKPKIRLAQAIKSFEAELSSEQKVAFNAARSSAQSFPPDQMDVMRLLSEMDKTSGVVAGKRCFGPRFTNFLEAVQRFASIGDVVVGGSQNMAACGVWALVRLTVLVSTTSRLG